MYRNLKLKKCIINFYNYKTYLFDGLTLILFSRTEESF